MKSLLVLAGVVMALGGCRFWYKPVPVANAIGEEQAVLSSDTLNVYRDERFEVYGPGVDAVYDGYEQLNRAYRAFERYFGSPAPRLALVLTRDADFAVDAATDRALRDRGFTPVIYLRPHNVRRRYSGLNYGGTLWPLAPTAARAMLMRYADAHLAVDVPRSDASLIERFPLWFRAAEMHLVGEAGSAMNDLDYVRERRSEWRPLAELVTFARPTSEDTGLDPSRRGDADDFTRLLAAQSSMFARYLVEHEGDTVLARLAQGYLTGRSFADMAAAFQSVPRTVAEIEPRFRAWLETLEN